MSRPAPAPETPYIVTRVAQHLARDLLAVGEEPGRSCQRIEFKSGSYTEGVETSHGGLCERALVDHFAKSIRKLLGVTNG